MEKLTGRFSYHVFVTCPKCHESIDLVDLEEEGELGSAVLGGYGNPGKWEKIGIEYQCPHCKTDFELNDLEY